MRKNRIRPILTVGLLGAILLCLAAVVASAWSNRYLPSGPAVLDRLTSLDKARLAEALHLKETLGEQVWPGWGQMEIPLILWNHEYAFLVGHPDPPEEWEAVPGDTFEGQPYYRKKENDPQNFAVQVGGRWVASMATKAETDDFLITMFQDFLPPIIEQIFPYRLLIQSSEVQIAAVLHESFHVYQALLAPDQLEDAELSHRLGDRYWEADKTMGSDWKAEIDFLAQALGVSAEEDMVGLARQFLEQRDQRRKRNDLDAELVDYERQLEWEEGLAKYIELEILRQAFVSREYQPLPQMEQDPDFKGYQTFERRWAQEISQMKRQAGQEGENRFYLTGMAQAVLLDRLAPGWKAGALAPGAFLEQLLRRAIGLPVAP